MTEIMIGGAKFQSEQVASKRTVQKDGKTMYEVTLKRGDVIIFPEQKDAQLVGPGGLYTAMMTGFDGAKYYGSDNKDKVWLLECQNSTVDVRGGNSIDGGDFVLMVNSKPEGWHIKGKQGGVLGNNNVMTDSRDTIRDFASGKGDISGAGVYTQGKQDYRSIFNR